MQVPLFSCRNGERKPLVIAECLAPAPGDSWPKMGEAGHDERMLEVMRSRGITRALVPTPAFNGFVEGSVPKGRMRSHWIDDEHELAWSTKPFEGYAIPPGEALISRAGGCPFVVGMGWTLDGRMRLLAAHAGRDSLIDRARMLREFRGESPLKDPARPFEGVVYSMVEAFRRMRLGIGPHRIELHMVFSIRPEVFLHSYDDHERGSLHAAMHEGVRSRWGVKAAWEVEQPGGGRAVALSLPDVFLAQAAELHVDRAYCYLPIPTDDIYPHTRHPDKAMRARRYLVVIHNRDSGPSRVHA